MSQLVKAFVTKSEKMSSVPRTHRWKKKTDSRKVFYDYYLRDVINFLSTTNASRILSYM